MGEQREMQIQHNEQAQRFEVFLDGQRAFLSYVLDERVMIMTHTEVPPAFQGRGIGGRIVAAGLDYARDHGLRVVPRCGFVAAYIRRHPEYLRGLTGAGQG